MRFFFLTLGLLLSFCSQAVGAAIEVTQLRVGAEHGYLVASCTTEGEIPYDYLDEALKHGVSLRLKFQIVLIRVRKLFRDQIILEQEVNRLLYYQAVKDEYLLQYVGSTIVPQRFSSLREALEKAGTLEALPLVPLAQLKPQSAYRLKVRVILKKEASLPFPFKIPIKLLHFLFGGGKMESDWASINFRL